MKLKSIIILFFALSITCYAKKAAKSAIPVILDNNYVQLSFSKSTGSAFYDNDGELQTAVYKPFSTEHDSTYTFNRDSYFFKLDISQMYSLDSNNEVGAEFGIAYAKNQLEQKYKTQNDTISSVLLINDNNLFEKIDFGIKYRTKFSSFILDAKTNFTIPLSKYKNSMDTTDYSLITSGYSSITPSLSLYMISPKYYLMLNGSYSFNSDDISDMYKIGFGAGLLTVEDAVLNIHLEYANSSQSINELYRFNPAKLQMQESNFRVGAGFRIKFMKNTSAGINYDILLTGKNTLNNNIMNIYLTYNLNFLK